MGAQPKSDQQYSYADYLAWELAEGERFELIYGEAYGMAAPGLRHQSIQIALASQFFNFLEGKPCKVYSAPVDVRLFYKEDNSDDTVVQPDIVIVCDEKKRAPESIHGAPDLVIEILSPSNTVNEMERKLLLYLKAGVQEYWVVNPENNSVIVYNFKDKGIYGYKNDDNITVATLPGLVISLNRVFAE